MFDWDAIIVGGGPAGLAAGLYLSRANYRTLLLEEESCGGKIKNVEWIENYPGFSAGVAGVQLANEMEAQAVKYGLKSETAKVSGIELFSDCRWVNCADGRGYTTAVVILAGGSRWKKLNVPGEEKLQGKGVFTCAFCDGGQFAGKVVAVCGGGDSGITEALYMSKIAARVIVIEALPELTATAILRERIAASPNITVRCGLKVEAVLGSNQVEGIEAVEVSGGRHETIKADGLLVHIGLDANTGYLKDILELDKQGQIVVNPCMETSVPSIFAAGDIRSGSAGQVSTAVGDGAVAAISAVRLLQQQTG
jgi:thioredoxin reductase (NADPH)